MNYEENNNLLIRGIRFIKYKLSTDFDSNEKFNLKYNIGKDVLYFKTESKAKETIIFRRNFRKNCKSIKNNVTKVKTVEYAINHRKIIDKLLEVNNLKSDPKNVFYSTSYIKDTSDKQSIACRLIIPNPKDGFVYSNKGIQLDTNNANYFYKKYHSYNAAKIIYTDCYEIMSDNSHFEDYMYYTNWFMNNHYLNLSDDYKFLLELTKFGLEKYFIYDIDFGNEVFSIEPIFCDKYGRILGNIYVSKQNA